MVLPGLPSNPMSDGIVVEVHYVTPCGKLVTAQRAFSSADWREHRLPATDLVALVARLCLRRLETGGKLEV